MAHTTPRVENDTLIGGGASTLHILVDTPDWYTRHSPQRTAKPQHIKPSLQPICHTLCRSGRTASQCL